MRANLPTWYPISPEGPYRVEAFAGGVIGGARARWGTDFHVCDVRGRTVAVFEHVPNRGGSLGIVRRRMLADRLAAQLNTPAPPRRTQADFSFRPTCPRCSVVCPAGARYCNECGTFLYLTDDELHELACPSSTPNSPAASSAASNSPPTA